MRITLAVGPAIKSREGSAVSAARGWRLGRKDPDQRPHLKGKGLKALRHSLRQSFGRIFGKKAASYVDSDMVSEGRSHVHRYRVDHLNAMHQAFVTLHAKSPAP